MNILNVKEQLYIDNSITHSEIHSYEPYLQTKLGNNDEIIIPVHEVDKYTLPCESFLYLEGKLTNAGAVSKTLSLVNNGLAFLFREIRYQLNGVTIDSVRDVGLTSTLKGYLSYNSAESAKLINSGWFPSKTVATGTTTTKTQSVVIDEATGLFNVCIPMKMLMGFFEDYKKVILNAKQELILVRDNTDINAVITTDDKETPKIDLIKLTWNIPHISVGIPQELALTKIIDKNSDIILAFRSWELIEYPELLKTNRHNWSVKTSTRVETPRHVVVAFQSGRRESIKSNMSEFDDINLRNIKVFLNSERYPYNDLNIDISKHKYAVMYEMYSQFHSAYYGKSDEPLFDPYDFKMKAPITYINCSHQKESLQTGPVVMRVEFELNKDLDTNSSAYCLILHDKAFTYNPLTKIVKQI